MSIERLADKSEKVVAFDVFISYSSLDKQIADAVKHGLHSACIRCWMAPDDITPGRDWAEEIILAIEQCPVMVLVWTQASMSSREVPKELGLAMNSGAIVIPFRLENIQPEGSFKYHLSGRHWLDVYDKKLDQAIDELIAQVSGSLSKSNQRLDGKYDYPALVSPRSCGHLSREVDEPERHGLTTFHYSPPSANGLQLAPSEPELERRVLAEESNLLTALKAWRRDQAHEQGVPPYVVFHDRTLVELAASKPNSLAALAGVSGIGSAKLERYGEALLGVLAPWVPSLGADTPCSPQLRGTDLIEKVRQMGDCSKSDLVRACGYVSSMQGGKQRLHYTEFYESLLVAKGDKPFAERVREVAESSSGPILKLWMADLIMLWTEEGCLELNDQISGLDREAAEALEIIGDYIDKELETYPRADLGGQHSLLLIIYLLFLSKSNELDDYVQYWCNFFSNPSLPKNWPAGIEDIESVKYVGGLKWSQMQEGLSRKVDPEMVAEVFAMHTGFELEAELAKCSITEEKKKSRCFVCMLTEISAAYTMAN